MKAKVNKAKTHRSADKALPFNMPSTGAGPSPKSMGPMGMKKGGKVAKYARGGGIEIKGKTRGKMC